jgi:hypothetical protein
LRPLRACARLIAARPPARSRALSPDPPPQALRAADEERAASAQHQRLFHSHTQARLAAEKAQLCQLRASLDEKDAERAEQTLSRMERRAQHAALTMDAAAKQRAAAIQATLNAYSTRADQCARTHAEQRAFFVRRQREVAEAHESAAARIAERREAWLHEHQLCAMENAQVRSEVHQFHQLQIDEKAGADKQAWALRHAELKLRLDARKAMQAQRSGESAARKTEHVERSLSHVEERLRARRERAEQDYARSTMRAEVREHAARVRARAGRGVACAPFHSALHRATRRAPRVPFPPTAADPHLRPHRHFSTCARRPSATCLQPRPRPSVARRGPPALRHANLDTMPMAGLCLS